MPSPGVIQVRHARSQAPEFLLEVTRDDFALLAAEEQLQEEPGDQRGAGRDHGISGSPVSSSRASKPRTIALNVS